MKKLCAVLAAVMLLAMCGSAFALRHMDREEKYVRDEAARRNIKLISLEEAQRIAAEKINESGIRFKDADLEDEDDYHHSRTDFRPIWSLEAVANGQEYDIDIDAQTGEILKFKLDD